MARFKLIIGARQYQSWEIEEVTWMIQGREETDDAGILYFRTIENRCMAISPHHWCYFYSEPISETETK